MPRDRDNESFTEEEEVVARLTARVLKLERHVDTLESELRLVRRKVRAMDMSRYGYNAIAETVQKVLSDNSWNISRNRPRKSYSSDEDESVSKRIKLKSRDRHSSTKGLKIVQRPPQPSLQDLHQKRKYKALLVNDRNAGSDRDYVPNSGDESSDDRRKSKSKKQHIIKIEKLPTFATIKREVPERGILKKDSFSRAPTATIKVEVDESAYENFHRQSVIGRKPKDIWVNFLTQRDDSGKITSSICKLCKKPVSARPYRLEQHIKSCQKGHAGRSGVTDHTDANPVPGPSGSSAVEVGTVKVVEVRDTRSSKLTSISDVSATPSAGGRRSTGRPSRQKEKEQTRKSQSVEGSNDEDESE